MTKPLSIPAGDSRSIRIAFTPGEPAGIGPDLAVRLAATARRVQLLVVACPHTLRQRAEQLKLPLALEPVHDPQAPFTCAAQRLSVWPVETAEAVTAGQLNTHNAAYVIETLREAVGLCRQQYCQALVTGPVNKGHLCSAGYAFSGHTEFLAEQLGTARPLMMLASEKLRVALLTTHLPLRDVPAAITAEALESGIKILWSALKNTFGIEKPRILVCALNPHAGEQGKLGTEEQDIIIPCIENLCVQGFDLVGPLPADTLFVTERLSTADAVLAMYHDQGLPVLKYAAFGQAVNITLGLPIIRTSVDHGTALDKAGGSDCKTGSLDAALQMAVELVGTGAQPEE